MDIIAPETAYVYMKNTCASKKFNVFSIWQSKYCKHVDTGNTAWAKDK